MTQQTNDTGENEPQLVDVDEAAARLKCSPEYIRKLERRGDLKAIRLGRLVRFPLEEIARFIRERVEAANADRGAAA